MPNKHASITVASVGLYRHAPLTLFDCVTFPIYTITVRDKPAAWLVTVM